MRKLTDEDIAQAKQEWDNARKLAAALRKMNSPRAIEAGYEAQIKYNNYKMTKFIAERGIEVQD